MFVQKDEGRWRGVWDAEERPSLSPSLGQQWFILPSHGWRDLNRIVEGRLWSHSVTSLAPVLPLALLGSPGPKSQAVSELAEQWYRVLCSISGSSRVDKVSSIVSVSFSPRWSLLASKPLWVWLIQGFRLGQTIWWVSLDRCYGGRDEGMFSTTYYILSLNLYYNPNLTYSFWQVLIKL